MYLFMNKFIQCIPLEEVNDPLIDEEAKDHQIVKLTMMMKKMKKIRY